MLWLARKQREVAPLAADDALIRFWALQI